MKTYDKLIFVIHKNYELVTFSFHNYHLNKLVKNLSNITIETILPLPLNADDSEEEDYKPLPAGLTDPRDEKVIPIAIQGIPHRNFIEVLFSLITSVKFWCAGPITKEHLLERITSPCLCLGGISHCPDYKGS